MTQPGTDVMILKEGLTLPKDLRRRGTFGGPQKKKKTQNKAKLCKILIITLVFEKNANFFAENDHKSQKIVIITSTPGQVPA
jgi:hypothetical protein